MPLLGHSITVRSPLAWEFGSVSNISANWRPKSSFHTRRKPHDEQAVPLVMARFQAYGFKIFPWGTEHRNARLAELLRLHYDPTSALIRHQPDLAVIHAEPIVRSVLCEVKSESQGRPNFAIAVDSFRSARALRAGECHVMYALVDLSTEQILACWADQIPAPSRIFVPKRWDYEQTRERLLKEWPGVLLVSRSCSGGSGTPFLLIPKTADYLLPLDHFIKQYLLGVPNPTDNDSPDDPWSYNDYPERGFYRHGLSRAVPAPS